MLQTLFHNENLCYLLCYCCKNGIFGENVVLEIEVKMLSANQIAGFLNQPFFQNNE